MFIITNNTNSSIAASSPSATVNITAHQFSKMDDSIRALAISVPPRKESVANARYAAAQK
jgi:hypothetical protein